MKTFLLLALLLASLLHISHLPAASADELARYLAELKTRTRQRSWTLREDNDDDADEALVAFIEDFERKHPDTAPRDERDRDGGRDRDDRDHDYDDDQDGDNGGCSRATMRYLSNQYLSRQPGSPASWTQPPSLFAQFHPDVVLGTNAVVGEIIGAGASVVQAILSGINVDYQIIAETYKPKNFFRRNSVMAAFNKLQGSVSLGLLYNISFHHYIEFTDDCKIKSINEFANTDKTRVALPDLRNDPAFWICVSLVELCAGHLPSFGTAADNPLLTATDVGRCYAFWRDASVSIIDNQIGGSAAGSLTGHSFSCLSSRLTALRNRGPAQAAFRCPAMGEAMSGMSGCF